MSPLIIACQSSHLRFQFEMIKCLLENDAEPNQSSSVHSQLEQQYLPYRTPLVTYIKHAHDRRLDLRIVRLLIGYGARVSFSRGRGMMRIKEQINRSVSPSRQCSSMSTTISME